MLKLEDGFEKGRSRSAVGAKAAAKEDHIGVKCETSGLIAKEKNVSLKAVELVEAAVKLSSEVKRNKQVRDTRGQNNCRQSSTRI
jgi:hypothetical protein